MSSTGNIPSTPKYLWTVTSISSLKAASRVSPPSCENFSPGMLNTLIGKRGMMVTGIIKQRRTQRPHGNTDIGLRNYALGIFGQLIRQEDLGFAFQNLVFLILKEKLRGIGSKIHYWRTKSRAEIDFIIDLGRKVIPLEVKYKDLSRPLVTRSFGSFIAKYAPERCLIINKSLRTTVKVGGSEILFLTLWDLIFNDPFKN